MSNTVEQRLTHPTTTDAIPRAKPGEGDWLNTGEAYTEAQLKGYEAAQSTFRRDLRKWRQTGQPPARLAAMGMKADLEVRAAAHDKDNSVKWLRFE